MECLKTFTIRIMWLLFDQNACNCLGEGHAKHLYQEYTTFTFTKVLRTPYNTRVQFVQDKCTIRTTQEYNSYNTRVQFGWMWNRVGCFSFAVILNIHNIRLIIELFQGNAISFLFITVQYMSTIRKCNDKLIKLVHMCDCNQYS